MLKVIFASYIVALITLCVFHSVVLALAAVIVLGVAFRKVA